MHLCMRTTVDIPDALLERARPILASRKLTLRSVVLDAIERLLDSRRPQFRLRDASVGHRPKRGKGVAARAINAAIDEMRERHR